MTLGREWSGSCVKSTIRVHKIDSLAFLLPRLTKFTGHCIMEYTLNAPEQPTSQKENQGEKETIP